MNLNGHHKTAPWYSRWFRQMKPLRESEQSDLVSAVSELTTLLMRNGADMYGLGIVGTTQHFRRQGRNYPFFDNENELATLRAASRILCDSGTYGAGIIEGLASYVLGDGLTYTLTPAQGVDPQLGAAVSEAGQRIIDLHMKRNQWSGGEYPSLELEFFRRSRRDGEAILVHFPQDDGTTDERFAEPDMLKQKPGTNFDEYGFGVKTDPQDTSRHLAYWIAWNYNAPEGEEYEPDFVTFFRANVDRNIKRGRPDFSFDVHDGLKAANILRNSLGEGAAQQASIASVMEYENATADQVEDLTAAAADYQLPDALTGMLQNIQRMKKGTNLHVPKGQKYIEGPSSANAQGHLAILDMLLRSASRPWNAPDWLASGDASGSTFANALHEESPFLRRIIREQKVYCEALKTAPWFALRHWIETNGLKVGGMTMAWDEVKQLVELTVTAPSPEVRDKLQEATRDQIYVMIGAKSPQMVSEEQGYDPQKVQDERDAFREANPDMAGGLAMPADMGGGMPTGDLA